MLKDLFTSSTLKLLNKSQKQLLAGILIVHLILVAFISVHQSLTFDEGGYFEYVMHWISGDYSRSYHPVYDSKTPVLAAVGFLYQKKNWLPSGWEEIFLTDYIRFSRPIMYGYFLVTAFFAFLFLFRICGPRKWVVAYLLLLFNPMILGYCLQVGTDISVMGVTIASVYLLWRQAETRQLRYFFWLCIVVPLSLVLKQACIYNLPLLIILTLLFYWQNKEFKKWLSAKKILIGLSLFAISSVVVINSFFFWKQSFIAWGNLPFRSNLLLSLQAHTSWFKNLPVPLPWGFINGYDYLQLHAEWGPHHPDATYRAVVIWQMQNSNGPISLFYVLTALFKVPLSYWLLALIGSWLIVKKFLLKGDSSFFKRYGFIIVSFLFLLFVLSFLNRFQSGFRHALVLFPFACALLGLVWYWILVRSRYLAVAILLFDIVSVARYRWYQMAYTNDLIWNKTNVYHYLTDSSVDYGQDMKAVNEFVQKHPEYKLLPPATPKPGKYILFSTSYFLLLGKDSDLENYRADWIIQNFKPVDHFHYTGMIYNITEQDIIQKGLSALAK